jgi:hypothetical protein
MEGKYFTNFTKKYFCQQCNTKCSRNKEWERHLITAKHLKNVGGSNLEENFTTDKEYKCHCDKIYKTHSGLWKHQKLCTHKINKEPSANEITLLTNLVLEIVKNNSELQKQTNELQKQNQELNKQVLDVCQKIQPANNISNSHINSHNKTFNLQFFLNEQCKDAMNIMDFVNTFKLDFSDFERIGEVGYVEGISNIVIDKLNEMDVYKRPIHCSDAKREIMYVKDKDVWEKENANNDKIRLALKHITKKNTDLIRPWAIAHPGVLNSDHRLSDKYQEMIIEAMGGNKKNKNMKEGEDKIIKKISKMVLIDKNYVKNE